MARHLGSDSDVADVVQLRGGLECRTYAFSLDGRRLVMKRFRSGDLGAAVEFENLSTVAAAAVPTPEPVSLDRGGAWFGTPTVVMEALPGRPEFFPKDLERWTRGAAAALAAIHELDPRSAGSVVIARWQRWRPDLSGLERTPRAETILERLRAVAANSPTVVSHDDYNPGNLLFHEGRLSGVVDWADLTLEPRQASVALYRHLLAVHPGGDAPDQFLIAYETMTGAALSGMPLWDLLYGLRGIGPVDHWARAFCEHGVMLTSEQIATRSRLWIDNALTSGDASLSRCSALGPSRSAG